MAIHASIRQQRNPPVDCEHPLAHTLNPAPDRLIENTLHAAFTPQADAGLLVYFRDSTGLLS